MPRCDIVRAQAFGFFQKRTEFDFSIAKHVGVGGSARLVFGKEIGKNSVHIFFGEIDGIIGNIQHGTNPAHVRVIVFGGAAAVLVVFFPVEHKQPDNVIALLF